MTTNLNPAKLAIALGKQADGCAKAMKTAETSEAIVINSTVAMLLYSLSIAVSDAMVIGDEPKPLDEENVGSLQS